MLKPGRRGRLRAVEFREVREGLNAFNDESLAELAGDYVRDRRNAERRRAESRARYAAKDEVAEMGNVRRPPDQAGRDSRGLFVEYLRSAAE
jgi:hypothetical protein